MSSVLTIALHRIYFRIQFNKFVKDQSYFYLNTRLFYPSNLCLSANALYVHFRMNLTCKLVYLKPTEYSISCAMRVFSWFTFLPPFLHPDLFHCISNSLNFASCKCSPENSNRLRSV